MQDNPLLASGHPRFRSIRAEHLEPAVRQRIDEQRRVLDERLAAAKRPTWENLVAPLDEADERVETAFDPAGHLVHVLHDDAMRAAHLRVQPLVTEAATRRAQDERLWKAFTEIRARADSDGLSPTRRKVLDDQLRDFRLAGAHLPPKEKERAAAIRVELSQLAVQFAQHVTDEVDAYRLVVDRREDLAGLPDAAVAAARAQALRDDPKAPADRWSFTLHAPSMMPFLTHQRNRSLRERMYRANVTRATSGKCDNTPVLTRILALRAELAKLLGFANFAEMALVSRMAKSPEEVHAFLSDLAARARPPAEREREALTRLAKERDGIETLERWDLLHYRELLRRERYDFSDEEVRLYFPVDRVLAGLRDVVRRLYHVDVTDRTGAAGFETWHADVRVLEFTNAEGAVLGHVYADLYARPGKQSGAWVGTIAERKRRADGSVRAPAAYLVCNFTAPAGDGPALLRHEEVRTLFHEFGHALHHVLTEVDERQCAGTSGVPWDGVELPSQFFENWIWHAEPLAAMSGHVETGDPLPKALLDRVVAARSYMKSVDIIRQMEYAISDLELHMRSDPMDAAAIHAVFASVHDRVSVFPTADWDRFENGFLHIFAGGYAAGYYGYAWSEVLAADAFSRFQAEGIWSPAAARDFRRHILARGGSADFMDLFVAYRGRRPTPDALLAGAGIA
jgi:oligopeptidase A